MKTRRRQPAPEPRHPGRVLAEVLGDTPVAVAARWFGMAPAELEALLAGRAPMRDSTAAAAGAVFGTGAGPWLEMQRLFDEASGAESAQAGEKIIDEAGQ